jgi:hypothetical protein
MDERTSTMDKLPIYSIYIRKSGEICKVLLESVFLETTEDEESYFSQKRLIEWVSQRRTLRDEALTFRLDDILLFHFLDTNSVDDKEFMHSYSVLESIVLDESMPLFHSLSSLYLLFRETETTIKKPLKILETQIPETIHLNYIDVDALSKSRTRKHLRINNRATRKVHHMNNNEV